FWTTVAVKKVNDVIRLQALVDKKKVVVTEATIRDALRLDDAEGVECLPNKEIFTELARMGYEKPSTKLTFYKGFFSSQWKFLIHTILQCMSAKRTSWNEFSSSMASAIIYLSSGRKFNFSKKQVGDLSTHTIKYTSPALTHKVFVNMMRVGKGFYGVETPLFEGNVSGAHDEVPTIDEEPSIPSPTPPTPPPQPSQDIPSTSQVQPTPPQSPQVQPQSPQPQQDAEIPMNLLQEVIDTCTALSRRVEHLELDKIAQALEITKLKRRVKKLERINKVKMLKLRRLQKVRTTQRVETSDETMMDDISNQGRIIAELGQDVDVVLEDDKEVADDVKVVQDDIDESVQDQGRKAESQSEIYKIDLEHANKVLRMQEDESEPPEVQEVVDVVTAANIITEVVTAASGTITPASTTITAAEAQVLAATLTVAPARVTVAPSRRRKGVVIRNPQEESTTSTIIPVETKSKDKGKWILDKVIDHVKKKAKEDPAVKKYQVLKRKPRTKAQAKKNMMLYLKNVAGFKMDYFKGMYYDDIPKRQKLDEEVEELKRHLQIVPNKDDDVYTEATPLARKVPVVDYEIIEQNNKPYYKIIRADERKYPLTRFTMDQMLNDVRLKVEEESEVSLELLSFGVDAAKEFKEKHAKCLMLLVKDLVLPSKDDAVD
nr:hypothetical protein [Tanacetum cinerariifolium]